MNPTSALGLLMPDVTSRRSSSCLRVRIGRSLLIMFAVTTFMTGTGLPGPSLGRAAEGTVVYVSSREARLESFLDADGVTGRRFFEACMRSGWILSPEQVDPDEHRLLDVWRSRLAVGSSDLVWIDPEPSNGDRLVWLGPPGQRLLVSCSGRPTKATDRLFADLSRGTESWLVEDAPIRWEEVVETLDLTTRENLAFRALEDSTHPLFGLRAAFLRDKRASNLALFLLAGGTPKALGLRLDLSDEFEGPVREFAEFLSAQPVPVSLAEPVSLHEQPPLVSEAARSRFLGRRIEASSGRVYGRIDRVLQSLAGEADATLIVDVLDSDDPFLVVYREDGALPPENDRGTWLARCLSTVE